MIPSASCLGVTGAYSMLWYIVSTTAVGTYTQKLGPNREMLTKSATFVEQSPSTNLEPNTRLCLQKRVQCPRTENDLNRRARATDAIWRPGLSNQTHDKARARVIHIMESYMHTCTYTQHSYAACAQGFG